jgi:flagellin
MVINTNTTADTAATMLESSSANLSKSLERLSSGTKIVSAADNPSGLAVSMEFGAQSSDISAAQSNVADATSFTQTQDGYLQQVATALTQMGQLAVESQDSTITDADRSLYNSEYQQLGSYIANVATKNFNGVSLFNGASNTVTIDGDGSSWTMGTVNLGAGTAYTTAEGQTISSTVAASSALASVTSAIGQLATDRATVGANEARLNYTSNQLSVEQTNVQSANSTVSDVNVATESSNYSQLSVLVQSGTSMLAQANALPQDALKLIENLV